MSGAARPGFGAIVLRWAVLLTVGTFMLLPLVAMLEFSTRGIGGARSLDPWLAIGASPDLLAAIWVSLKLAVLTVVTMLVLLLPTMVWVQLRVPELCAWSSSSASCRSRSRRSCWSWGSPRSTSGSPICSANPPTR